MSTSSDPRMAPHDKRRRTSSTSQAQCFIHHAKRQEESIVYKWVKNQFYFFYSQIYDGSWETRPLFLIASSASQGRWTNNGRSLATIPLFRLLLPSLFFRFPILFAPNGFYRWGWGNKGLTYTKIQGYTDSVSHFFALTEKSPHFNTLYAIFMVLT